MRQEQRIDVPYGPLRGDHKPGEAVFRVGGDSPSETRLKRTERIWLTMGNTRLNKTRRYMKALRRKSP
jgi:hypothetical protein